MIAALAKRLPFSYGWLIVVVTFITMAIGVCLYLGTGMVLGIPFQLMLTRWFDREKFMSRLGATTILALALWIFNYYVILSWLQPALIGGNWIASSIPWWVGALTHLIFGWTVLLAQPLGGFIPYHHPPEVA